MLPPLRLQVSQPGLLTFVNQLKGARGVTIISTAIGGDLIKSAGTQMRIERTLRRQRDEQGIHGFTQVAAPRERARVGGWVAASVACGGGPDRSCSLEHTRLQPQSQMIAALVAHTVAASITHTVAASSTYGRSSLHATHGRRW